MSEAYPDLLVWVDVETTGLSVETDYLLELGVLVTDARTLTHQGSRSWVIHQPGEVLGSMSDWCLRQHGYSGLIADSAASRHNVITVAKDLGNYLEALECEAGTVPMCGASVHFDRAFLRRDMPRIERWFYYGNLDVSTLEKVRYHWFPGVSPFESRALHRVDSDNVDAVDELRYYREHMFGALA